jgi:NAD(P)H dehydrogenase (quinone)
VDADVDSPFCYARVNALTERAFAESGCAESGCAVAAVRASVFTEFFASLVELAAV